jgi:alpha-D-xyloside xylohydrolase
LHGSNSYRVPWHYDEEAVAVLSRFTKLKCSLMPYLYRAAVQAHEHGTPMLRAMALEFPDDPACDYLDLQYMLGDSLLVAPIFSQNGSVSYYVPEGKWTHLLNGNVMEGPRWVRETHDFLSLPLLVRPNSVIPIGNHTDRPDYDYSDRVMLQVYQLADGKSVSVEIPSPEGKIETTFEISREGGEIHIQRNGPAKAWSVSLAGDPSTKINIEGQTNQTTLQLK